MIEVAKNDGYALALFSECVGQWDADLVKRHERCPCSGGVRRFDRLGGKPISARHKNDGVTAIRPAANSEVVRECAIRYPSVRSLISKASYMVPTAKTNVLLRARDDPLIPIFVGVSLHAADIAPCKCLADRQTDKLLTREDVRDDLGLELRRTKVNDRWQTDHIASE